MQVLLVSSGRLRLGSLGVADMLSGPISSPELQLHQREDLAVRTCQPPLCKGLGLGNLKRFPPRLSLPRYVHMDTRTVLIQSLGYQILEVIRNSGSAGVDLRNQGMLSRAASVE